MAVVVAPAADPRFVKLDARPKRLDDTRATHPSLSMRYPARTQYFAAITAVIAAFVVYGSLFPFAFDAPGGGHPLSALLATWRFVPENPGNLIGNIFFYFPLGLFGVLALGHRISAWLCVALITLAGALFSFAMELTQFYITVRVSTIADVYPNTLGAGLGATAGLILGTNFRRPSLPALSAQPVPILLLLAFVGYRLFPYVPTLDLHQYWQALKPVLRDPQFDAFDIIRYTVMWLVVAVLGRELIGAAPARLLLIAAVLGMLGAQVAILNNSVSAAEIVGGAAACGSWLMVSRTPERIQTCLIAAALAALVIGQRLQPFDFSFARHAFGWIAFESFLHGSMAVNTLSFLEKFFLYGSLVWLLTRAGLGFVAAGLWVALGLLATSVVQTWLPGRSAEITDATMALIIAGLFALITRSADSAQSSVPRRTEFESDPACSGSSRLSD